MTLASGQLAPAFYGIDQHGKTHTLEKYAGNWLLLYFYPKDGTPGCTTEACSFRDSYEELADHVSILGVSKDSEESHQQFAEKYHLPFPLLADTSGAISETYGAGGILFPKRVSFLIDPRGQIAKIYPKVDVKKHTQEILADLENLYKKK